MTEVRVYSLDRPAFSPAVSKHRYRVSAITGGLELTASERQRLNAEIEDLLDRQRAEREYVEEVLGFDWGTWRALVGAFK